MTRAKLLELPERARLLLFECLAPLALVARAILLGTERRIEGAALAFERSVSLDQLLVRERR